MSDTIAITVTETTDDVSITVNESTDVVTISVTEASSDTTISISEVGAASYQLQDDDAFSSASASKVASSESIKAYVDAQILAVTHDGGIETT